MTIFNSYYWAIAKTKSRKGARTVVDVKKLLEYNEEVRHSYFEVLCGLPWKEFTQNREASFHSMRNIFLHTLGAIDYWLDVLQQEKLFSREDYDKYTSYPEVEAYMKHVENRMHDCLKTLSLEGLNKTYALKDDAQKTVVMTAEDILVHVFEEEVHHRGELIALLWQIGVEPPMMSWKQL